MRCTKGLRVAQCNGPPHYRDPYRTVIGVVLLLPVGDDRACFVNVVERVHVQTLVPDAVGTAPGLVDTWG